MWPTIPRNLRAVAFKVPPGITNEVKTLEESARMAMYVKLNELRRERCIPLSDPSQQWQWANESWDIVPMSKLCKNRFWELMRVIPLTTPDSTKWSHVVSYLQKCPEKPTFKSDANRHFDLNAMYDQVPLGGPAFDVRRSSTEVRRSKSRSPRLRARRSSSGSRSSECSR